jgi:hypothetical protein
MRTCGVCGTEVVGCESCHWSIEPSVLVYCVKERRAHFHPTCAPTSAYWNATHGLHGRRGSAAIAEPWTHATLGRYLPEQVKEEIAKSHAVPMVRVEMMRVEHCGLLWSNYATDGTSTRLDRHTESGRCGDCGEWIAGKTS